MLLSGKLVEGHGISRINDVQHCVLNATVLAELAGETVQTAGLRGRGAGGTPSGGVWRRSETRYRLHLARLHLERSKDEYLLSSLWDAKTFAFTFK